MSQRTASAGFREYRIGHRSSSQLCAGSGADTPLPCRRTRCAVLAHRPADPWILYVTVAALHFLGLYLFLPTALSHPAIAGLGVTAYLLGLRHGFDADHIAAIDETVRYLLSRHQRPQGTGFFFSAGHSTVVFVLAMMAVAVGTSVHQALPELQHLGSLLSEGVSGLFLLLIGLINLRIVLDLFHARKCLRNGSLSARLLDNPLPCRGLIGYVLGRRLREMVMIRRSSQMYWVGLLFGLGFDTASEIVLLVMTGIVAGRLPAPEVLALPVFFAAAMSLIDTTDSVLMVSVYDSARDHPARQIGYNLMLTAASMGIAIVVGVVEIGQLVLRALDQQVRWYRGLEAVNSYTLGMLATALFLSLWIGSIAVRKVCR